MIATNTAVQTIRRFTQSRLVGEPLPHGHDSARNNRSQRQSKYMYNIVYMYPGRLRACPKCIHVAQRSSELAPELMLCIDHVENTWEYGNTATCTWENIHPSNVYVDHPTPTLRQALFKSLFQGQANMIACHSGSTRPASLSPISGKVRHILTRSTGFM